MALKPGDDKDELRRQAAEARKNLPKEHIQPRGHPVRRRSGRQDEVPGESGRTTGRKDPRGRDQG